MVGHLLLTGLPLHSSFLVCVAEPTGCAVMCARTGRSAHLGEQKQNQRSPRQRPGLRRPDPDPLVSKGPAPLKLFPNPNLNPDLTPGLKVRSSHNAPTPETPHRTLLDKLSFNKAGFLSKCGGRGLPWQSLWKVAGTILSS